MTDNHDAPSTLDIREMINGAVDILNDNGNDIKSDPVLYSFALGQLASAAYLGQIAGTLSELLAIAKTAEEVAARVADHNG